MKSTDLKNILVFGSLWSFGGFAVATLAGLATVAILARMINPTELGLYFLVTSQVTIFSTVIQLGLGRTVVRLIGSAIGLKDEPKAWKDAVSIFQVAIVAAAGGSVLLYFWLADFTSLDILDAPELSAIKGYIIFWTLLFSFRNLLSEAFRGFHNIRSTMIFGDPATRVLFFVMLVVTFLLNISIDIKIAVAMMAVATAVCALSGGIALWVRKPTIAMDTQGTPTLTILQISLPFFVVNLTNLAYSQSDLWIVGSILGKEDVALYGAAIRLVLLVSAPLIVANSVLPSLISTLQAGNQFPRMQTLLQTTATAASVPTIVVLATFLAFPETVLSVVYGSQFASAATVLRILSMGHLLSVLAGSGQLTLMMTGYHTTVMKITVLSAFALVAGGILAALSIGIVGVAAINAAVTILSCVTSALLVRRHLGISTFVSARYLRLEYIREAASLIRRRRSESA